MAKDNYIRVLPPREYLLKCFSYNRKSGELIWQTRPREHFKTDRDWNAWNTLYSGRQVKTLVNGYYAARVLNVRYQAHRIIWKMVTGNDPSKTPDHIDRDPTNNRWNNLRLATPSQQQYNSRTQKNNTSGHRGVRFRSGKWLAEIGINGITKCIGVFNDKSMAVAARKDAVQRLYGDRYRED